ncbi:MAG: hypothetical protein LUF04_15420, partial [Bacteroides sp.]|nr:hypothetical protein [Bacteroides sp.]
ILNMIHVENKRKKPENIRKQHPDAIIIDITSASETDFRRLSPFYPHGNIPVPFTPDTTAASVEGIWQGLKVFQTVDIDPTMFTNTTMKNLKRTVRKFGKPLGHRKGAHGDALLNYFDARMQIYIPSYKWMLTHKAADLILQLKTYQQEQKDIVLLDYNTNTNFRDISSPLSHAGLIKAFLENTFPKENVSYEPLPIKNSPRKSKPKTTPKKKKDNGQQTLPF